MGMVSLLANGEGVKRSFWGRRRSRGEEWMGLDCGGFVAEERGLGRARLVCWRAVAMTCIDMVMAVMAKAKNSSTAFIKGVGKRRKLPPN